MSEYVEIVITDRAMFDLGLKWGILGVKYLDDLILARIREGLMDGSFAKVHSWRDVANLDVHFRFYPGPNYYEDSLNFLQLEEGAK